MPLLQKPDWLFTLEHNEKIEDEARQLWADIAKVVASLPNVHEKGVPAKWADVIHQQYIDKFKIQ